MRGKALLWLAWLTFSVCVTWSGFAWQIGYFRSPGPHFHRLVVILLAVSPLLLVAWHWIRRWGWWKYEFMALAGLPVIACFAYEPLAATVVAAVAIVCFATGRRAQKLLRIDAAGAAEHIAVSMALGFGILHCVLFTVGLSGWYFSWFFVTLLASGGLLCRTEIAALPAELARLNDAWRATTQLAEWPGTLFSAFALILDLAATVFALAPSLAFDVLKFHLPAAQYYASQHALQAPPYLPYAYYPQSIETMMTLGFTLAGQPTAQLLPALYFVFALLALYSIGRLCGLDRIAALAGVLFTAAAPAVHWTGASGKNDFALVFFILVAILGYLRWIATQNFRWILLGTFCIAMGAGVKHIVLFAIPPLALLYGYAALRQPKRILAFGQVLFIFAAFALFWHVRAWLATGNPVYPSGASSAMTGVLQSQSSILRDIVLRYVQLPWALHFRGSAYFESVSRYPLGIFAVVFAPVWFLIRRRSTAATRACLLFCAMYLLYWASAIPVIRYGIAPIAILLLLTAGTLVDFCRTMPRLIVIPALVAAIYVLTFSACGVAINEINEPQMRYFARRIDREQYLREALLPYRSLEYLKGVAQPGESIFSVDACALAYAPNQDHFDCMLLTPARRNQMHEVLLNHRHHFVILPHSQTADMPAGWRRMYADSAYHVYRSRLLP